MSDDNYTPIIAVIVSNRMNYINDFLLHYRLDPNLFGKATDSRKLSGVPLDVPIIETYRDASLGAGMDDALRRFKSVRFIDY